MINLLTPHLAPALALPISPISLVLANVSSHTPSGPSEAPRVPCTASPYMLRPGTHEIHFQPYHTFDIHWSYSPGLDAQGDHTFCTRMYGTPSTCDHFYHT